MQPWVIVLFVVILVHDSLREPGSVAAGVAEQGQGWLPWVVTLVPLALLAVVVQALLFFCGRGLDRTGRMRYVALADRIVVFGRYAAIGVYALGVLVFGWLDAIRAAMGDVIMLDELAAVLPPIYVIAAGWWSIYPIERRVRDALIFRHATQGGTVWPTPSRGAFVWWNFRHHALLILAAMLAIMAWVETCHLYAGDVAGLLGLGAERESLVFGVMQLVGVGVVFLLAPTVVRVGWDTVPLGPGALRERLVEMCRRHRVKVGGVLIWRTHGTLVNAAAIGLMPPLRYILISDALLDLMPRPQVEAVMAHEIAHVRLRHIPWLVASMIAASGVLGLAVFGVTVLLGMYDAASERIVAGGVQAAAEAAGGEGLAGSELFGIASAIVVVGGALVSLGFVSRRMEWQADAFAARQLSVDPPRAETIEASTDKTGEVLSQKAEGLGPSDMIAKTAGVGVPAVPVPRDVDKLFTQLGKLDGSARISSSAVGAMVGALQAVAEVSHIPTSRWSWRHGSIAGRQRRLRDLIGLPADRLPIDRHVAWLKRAIGVVLIGLVVLAIVM